jgi:hypothetical protein
MRFAPLLEYAVLLCGNRAEESMLHHRSVKKTSAERDDLERKVEMADALLRETIEHLARCCPPPLLGTAACESLEGLRPHVQEALEALGEIEGRRDLTDEELSRRYAFKMLLAARV